MSSGPRRNGVWKCSLSAAMSLRQRPGTMTLSASSGAGSRRRIMSPVMSAATFTPTSWIE
jgi:hypothetical protein